MGMRRRGTAVVAAAALWALTACGQQAPDADSDATSARDPTAAAAPGARADPGSRRYAGGTMVVIPHAADLEPSTAMAFSEYDIDDGTDKLAIHIPGPVGCPSIGFTARVEESAERVSVRLIRGLHRGMPPCQGASPEQKREYGVVVVDLEHPLGNRTVLSLG
ncbi:hypothetical protein OHA40_10325 [Nocardia sp. NBC_00508]|uniref:hypothetical protein n=1 Tax=Nocardia sp. NBC_00508 TaxID=2975992 RepID=UPI002E815873|nr:hypothetical protein [Nocardia sp. NBC_00508]WUD68462.1 hypothetical protein OHA40_10325 [Nocardia sp. NBC_00508]